MSKSLINVGCSVVFSQRYLFNREADSLYGKIGTVLSIDGDTAEVEFEGRTEPTHVDLSDLDPFLSNEQHCSETSLSLEAVELATLHDHHDLGGCTHTQLIVHAQLAQDDPILCDEITQLMTH